MHQRLTEELQTHEGKRGHTWIQLQMIIWLRKEWITPSFEDILKTKIES